MSNTDKFRNQAQYFIIEYLLDHPCIDCGEDDPIVLEFDHRDPSTKILSISELILKVTSMRFEKLRDEMDKCDVRCACCHRRKTAKQRNYKRYRLAVEMKIINY